MTQRIVILGGGPAGYEAAIVAAELGATVTIVSNEGLGGNSVLWDCVPSKALIVAAEAMGWLDMAGRMGVTAPQGAASEIDFRRVAANVLELGLSQSADIEQRVTERGVQVVRGRGRLVGPHKVAVRLDPVGNEIVAPQAPNELVLDADYVLLATGSQARQLPFFVPDGERVLTGQQIYGFDALPEQLIVVGSGATGAEFAHAFRRFGVEVTLVSSRELILPTEDPDAASVIEDVFERRGMRILRNVRAVSCENRSDHVAVGLDDGTELTGSHVLFTVGQVPVTQDIGLDTCNVSLDGQGAVVVDSVGRTSARWMYAAGDVTGGLMLASVAAMQGRTAMWHALGQAVQPIRWDSVAATVFTDPEVATVGMSPEEAVAAGMTVATAKLDFRRNPRAKMIQGLDGFVKVHAMVGSGTVVGGVVVSARASDLIQPLAVAVQHRLTVEQLAQTITVYPSMAGSVAECARMLMVQLKQ